MKSSKILLFIACIIAALALIGAALPADGFELAGKHIGFASLHTLANPEVLEASKTPESQAATDSVTYYRALVNSGNLRFWLPNPHYLDSFWRQAENARRQGRIVRVLHYGDSQIEMDRLSARLRSHLQRRFGGGGPGMLPFHTITASLTVNQSTNGNLQHLASFGDSTVVRSHGNYGPMMQCFRLSGGSASTTLKASRSKMFDDRAKQFSRITLLYDNRGGHLSAELNDRKHKANYPAATNESGIGCLVWQLDSSTNAMRLTVRGSADLHGVLVDDGPGVAVDNIPMRGCSGQQFTLVPEEKLSASYLQMDIGLIIMQFGGNSVPYIKTPKQISTYCQSLGNQIDHVRQCCPRAKILFVGPSDMSTRQQGQLKTYPMLPALVDSLAATALRHGAAYWSIYHAMGGENSMTRWTKQGLAGQDYIHFSQRGADLMGDRMAEALENSYQLYCHERKIPKEKGKKKKGKRK